MPLEQAEHAVKEGRVTVSGRVVRQPMAALQAGDLVRLDGHALDLTAKTRVLAYHKPAGVDVTSNRERDKTPTVFEKLAELLTPELAGYTWHAVGRLDRDTTGLLLFTNDERLVAHVTSPESKLPKIYRAKVSGKLTAERLSPLTKGFQADGQTFAPARFEVLDSSEIELTLTEGKNHQVKRMLGAAGYPVLALERIGVGGVRLDLPVGDLRELSADEVQKGLSPPSSPGRT